MTGSGTELDPYIITTVDDLQAIENDLDAYYELGGHIDASAISGWNGGEGFIPIGYPDNEFIGSFDGKEYTITGLYINRAGEEYGQGLFHLVNSPAIIKDVTLADVDITANDQSNGALIGEMYGGTVSNCHSSGTMTGTDVDIYGGLIGWIDGGTVDGCSSSCTVVAPQNVGGLIGYVYGGVISNCHASGNATSTLYSQVGGFAGVISNAVVENCYATGNGNCVEYNTGGFVGYMSGDTISHCYATGAVICHDEGGGFAGYITGGALIQCYATGNVEGEDLLGGFVGYAQPGTITIDDCYARGDITGDAYVAGFIGYNAGAVITNCYAIGMTTGNAYLPLDVPPNSDDSDAGTWTINPSDGVYWDKVLTNDGDTTYIQAESNTCKVLFGSTISIPAGAQVTNVRIYTITRNVSSGTTTLAAVMRVNGTEYSTTNVNRTNTVYALTGHTLQQTNPDTGLPWTVDDVNGVGANPLQAWGAKVTDATPNIRFTQIYIEIAYYVSSTQSGFCYGNVDTITNCFWDTETSGQATSDGGTGKTTAEMKTQSTFTDAGWDFTTPIWTIQAEINDGYPSFAATLFKALVLYLELSLLDRCQYAIFNSRSITLAIRN